ncbi:MAG: hypothetical protein Q4C59_14545 [Lachnospiraceae bacterium]|nr:hypothetical protein [Lachnospiraceae bacterium]
MAVKKKERKWDMGYIRKTFPKTVFVELPGVGHGEYFTLHPEKFVKRVLHFVGAGE